MFQVLGGVWALLIGMVLIMAGNGMQSTLMGVRGGIEGFSTLNLSIITAGYFVGFLLGARLAPRMIRHVGHVRVFAALGSFMSAALIAYPLLAEPAAWAFLRIVIGFSMSGIYVTAESWLNNSASNATRGKLLSAYMLAQTVGDMSAQGMLNLADPAGPALFIADSMLVSLSFAPILLSASPVPVTQSTKAMSLRRLFRASPLGAVGIFLLGGVYSAQAGMAAVYGSTAGLGVREISILITSLLGGSLVLQYPIGWLSDRMDRRRVIILAATVGAAACTLGFLSDAALPVLMAAAFFTGGMAMPLYSLLVAYVNDYLDPEDMPAASGTLIFAYGSGAITGPIIAGQAMELTGPQAFWLVLAGLFAAIALYGLWRMTRRPGVSAEDASAYFGTIPTGSSLAIETAQEAVQYEEEQAEDSGQTG
ncbi:MAG: MFS transporter [Roseovarius sp.]